MGGQRKARETLRVCAVLLTSEARCLFSRAAQVVCYSPLGVLAVFGSSRAATPHMAHVHKTQEKGQQQMSTTVAIRWSPKRPSSTH